LKADLIHTVKKEMLKLGYSCKDFMNLKDSFSEGHSQEVLLAAGWLISTQEIIDIFISQLHNSQIDNEYFTPEIVDVRTF
jgi:hypothetical protein